MAMENDCDALAKMPSSASMAGPNPTAAAGTCTPRCAALHLLVVRTVMLRTRAALLSVGIW